MKIPITLAAVFVAYSGFGQTNFYHVLQCRNRTYLDATIDSVSPATVTVFWDGGGEKVAMTNLPAEVRRQYHYSPEGAEKYLAAEMAKKLARQAADNRSIALVNAAKSKLGPPETIRVVKVISGYEVQIIRNGYYALAYIHNLPQDVVNFVQDYNATKADVEARRYVNTGETVMNRVGNMASRNFVSTGIPTDNAKMAINAQLHLSEMFPQLKARTTVVASPSEYLVSPGVRQWEFQGIPEIRAFADQ